LAEDTRRPGNPTCVVKRLKPPNADPDFLQTARRLFNSEAETLEMLGNHDQIPRLLAYFEEAGDFYLVEEFIAGHPLTQELATGSPWNESQVIQLLQEVLPILEFVHSHQVIHRDIKPDNLIRREADQKLVLVDFGAVKQVKLQTLQVSDSGNHHTVAIGTPGYMPSEQSQGRPRPSSDIYALGMICIQVLTGLAPHELEEDPQTGEVCWRPASLNRDVSDRLVGVISQMVRHYFTYRYQSATEVLEALQPLTQPSPEAMAAVSHLGRYYWEQVCQMGAKLVRSISAQVGRGKAPDGTLASASLSSSASVPSVPSAGKSPILPAHAETLVVAPSYPVEAVSSSASFSGASAEGAVSPSVLALILGTPRWLKFGGAVALGAIVTLMVTRQQSQSLPSAASVPSPNQSAQPSAQPSAAPRVPSVSASASPVANPATCGVITEPSNLRMGANGAKSGKILLPETRVNVTGRVEDGWVEIDRPNQGWVWETRLKKGCS
jgi:serine/threonine protein kinase